MISSVAVVFLSHALNPHICELLMPCALHLHVCTLLQAVRRLIKANHAFERIEVTEDEARAVFANSPFKQRYISQALARGGGGHQSHDHDRPATVTTAASTATTSTTTVAGAGADSGNAQRSTSSVAARATLSLYRCGDFVDLCRGPHVASTGVIGDIALLSANASMWDPAALRAVGYPAVDDASAEISMQRVHGVAFAARDGVCDTLLVR